MSFTAELWDVSGLIKTGSPPSHMGNITNVVEAGFQDLLSEPGSGSLTIPIDDSHVTTILNNDDLVIRLTTPGGLGARSFEFFVEQPEFVFAATKPQDRLLKISGRGMLAYLDHGVQWSTTTTQYTSPSQTYAQTLIDNFTAAQGRGALKGLFWNFDGSTDSTQPRPPGLAWTTGNHVVNWRVGENYLDQVLRVYALGNENYCFLNTTGTPPGLNHIQLDLYTNGRGIDRSGSVIFQLPGDFGYAGDGDQQNLSLMKNLAQRRAAALIEGSAGNLVEYVDSGMVSSFGRRETYLSHPQAGAANSELTHAGAVTLGLLNVEQQPIVASLLVGPGHYNPYVDYFPGDYVGINAPPWYTNAKHRLVGLTVAQLMSGQLSVTGHFNSLRLEARLRQQRQLAY